MEEVPLVVGRQHDLLGRVDLNIRVGQLLGHKIRNQHSSTKQPFEEREVAGEVEIHDTLESRDTVAERSLCKGHFPPPCLRFFLGFDHGGPQ
jgi:hypothetical protein